MRADWDRRVAHDYLFWMSDGWQSEAAMWASGERDFGYYLRPGLMAPARPVLRSAAAWGGS